MRTERAYLTASNNRWVFLLLIFIVVIPLLYNIIMPIDREEPVATNGSTIATTSTLSLKDITKNMSFVCLNDYVYMHPKGYPRALEPVLINGNDISTGARLIPCDDYELVYNAVLSVEDAMGKGNE
tara:strand:- start:224445 stop:224822 length:378 start_codon:yes stop_codon:yes gene_type:complete